MPSFPDDCCHPVGPKDAKIVLVGEAPGEQEQMTGIPFIGNAGQELDRLLNEAGIKRAECYLTNVLLKRPPNNKLDAWCLPKKELPSDYSYQPLSTGQYLHPDLTYNVQRLRDEIAAVQPNIVVALGGTAAWALFGTAKISSIRGAVAELQLVPGIKGLATYHPSYLFKVWQYRPIVLADLFKAARERHFSDIRRPARRVFIEPTLGELETWRSLLVGCDILSTDIETTRRTITCIGFSPTVDTSYVVPFYDGRKPDGNYWPSHEHEKVAWEAVRDILASPAKKLFQNGLYDLQYLTGMGFQVRNCADDTMILHHALYPEMPKDLGFLGSIYTNESSWKLMRKRSDAATKKDE